MSDLATRAAALVTAHTGKACPYPVPIFRRSGDVWWLYLYNGLDLAVMAGPKDAERGQGFAVVRADLQGCASLGDALAVVEALAAVEVAA